MEVFISKIQPVFYCEAHQLPKDFDIDTTIYEIVHKLEQVNVDPKREDSRTVLVRPGNLSTAGAKGISIITQQPVHKANSIKMNQGGARACQINNFLDSYFTKMVQFSPRIVDAKSELQN